MNRFNRWLPAWLLPALLIGACVRPGWLQAEQDKCAVCNSPLGDTAYTLDDAVTLEKKSVCKTCAFTCPACFLCSLPVRTNSAGCVQLPDQRVLCARDAQNAILNEDNGLRLCRQVRDRLDHLLSRFVSFPETNVTLAVVDRVNLQDLFKIAGNDYHCPNVWGYTQTKTNHGVLEFRISIMSGLPSSWFQATCAHEYTHAWLIENVPAARMERLNRDSIEGFCELIAWLLMADQNDADHQARLLRNAYTRGQIDLFVAAEKRQGLNDILDWMRYGTDDKLSAADPLALRRVEMPSPARAAMVNLPSVQSPVPAVPEKLVLKAIFWDPKRPLALINDQTLGANELGRVRVGSTNLSVRCVNIQKTSVRIQIVSTGEERELELIHP